MECNMVEQIIHYCNVSVERCPKIADHIIDYYDFTFVLEGKMTYYADGEKIILKKGDAIFLRPGTLRRRAEGEGSVHYVSFNFIAMPDIEFPFDTHIQDCVNQDIRKLISVYSLSHLSAKFHAKEKCHNILNYILLELSDITSSNCKNDNILKILKYIDEHITEKISLKDIAEHFHMSKEYISNAFSKETGMQLVYYINEQKVLLAKKIITTQQVSLQSISQYLGFESYDYFSKTFKKHIGTTPSQLKKNSQVE